MHACRGERDDHTQDHNYDDATLGKAGTERRACRNSQDSKTGNFTGRKTVPSPFIALPYCHKTSMPNGRQTAVESG